MRPSLQLFVSLVVLLALAVPAVAQTAEQRIRKALDEPTVLEFDGTPLKDALAQLSAKHKIPIVLDACALEHLGLNATTPIAFHARDLSLRSALHLLLGKLNLRFTIEEDVLHVTLLSTHARLVTRTYPVRDLLPVRNARSELVEDEGALLSLVTHYLRSSNCIAYGIHGNARIYDGNLMVHDLPEVHEQIERFLTASRKLPSSAAAGNARVEREAVPCREPSPTEISIRAALAEPTEWDFTGETLKEVAQYIAVRHNIPVRLFARDPVRKPAHEGPGLDGLKVRQEEFTTEQLVREDRPVTHAVSGVSLRSGLRLMYASHYVAYVVRHDTLLLLDPTDHELQWEHALYPVADLLDLPSDASGAAVEREMRKLCEKLTGAVEPSSWSDIGGSDFGGLMTPYVNRGALFVSNTSDVHEQLSATLAALRAAHTERPPEVMNSDREYCLKVHAVPFVQQGDNTVSIPSEHVQELVTKTIEPESWAREAVYIRAFPNSLVVKHERRVQQEIQELISKLTEASEGSTGGGFGGGME